MAENKKLNDIFGLPSVTTSEDGDVTEFQDNDSDLEQARTDFEDMRIDLIDVAKISQMSLAEMSQLAAMSQDEKFYASLSKMIVATVQSKLAVINLHEKKLKFKPVKGGIGDTTINNNLIITTAELQKLLKGKIEEQ